MTSEAIDQSLSQFEQQKRLYFAGLAMRSRNELKLHEAFGLLERDGEGKRDWGNVSEHCLVEVARVDVLSGYLGLSDTVRRDLRKAAALHDFFKKREKEILEKNGLSWEAMDKAEAESERVLQSSGFSERVVRLSGSMAHDSLSEVEAILEKDVLSENDTAFLVMHYVDDYTVNNEWVRPAHTSPDGRTTNDLDRRVDKNEANPRYAIFNEEARKHFVGETSYQAQRRIGHLVEERLVNLMKQHTGESIEPLYLPEYIDEGVKRNIAATSLELSQR